MDELRWTLDTKDGELNKIVQDTSFFKHCKSQKASRNRKEKPREEKKNQAPKHKYQL